MSATADRRAAPAAPATLLLTLLLAVSVLPLGRSELKFHLLAAMAGVAALALGGKHLLARPGPAVVAPLVGLYLWAGLSLAWAPDRYRAVSGLLWLVALLVPALAAARLGQAALPGLALATLAVAVPSLGWGLAQYAGLVPALDWANPIRLAGTFVNSNLYAAWCGVVLLVAAGTLLDRSVGAWLRALAVLAVALAAASLPLTASRGGWLAAAAGLVFLTVTGLARPSQSAAAEPGGPGTARAVPILVTALLAVAALALVSLGGARIAERISHAGTYSISHRLSIWAGTLELLRARPLGVGLGGFEAAFPPYRLHSDRFRVNFAHSDVLELAAVLGIPGALALLTLVQRALSPEREGGLASRMPAPLARGVLAALALLAVQSLWDFPLRKPTLALFAAAALGAFSGGRQGAPRALPARGVAPAALLLLVAAAPLVEGERLRGAAERKEAARALASAERAYAAADRWLWPGDPSLARAAGAMNLALARVPALGGYFLRRAQGWFELALGRAPGDAESHLDLALLHSGAGRAAEARAHFLAAVALDPQDGTTLRAAAEALAASGDASLAFALEARALDTQPVDRRPAELALLAAKMRLPPEVVALAPARQSPRRDAYLAALEEGGLHLAARLHAARAGTP